MSILRTGLIIWLASKRPQPTSYKHHKELFFTIMFHNGSMGFSHRYACQIAFSTLLPKPSGWCLWVPKIVVKNSLFHQAVGHFVLKCRDTGCYFEPVFANGAIGDAQSMGHQSNASETLLSHVASASTVLWYFSQRGVQKQARGGSCCPNTW